METFNSTINTQSTAPMPRRLHPRTVRAVAAGLSAPALLSILAACGDSQFGSSDETCVRIGDGDACVQLDTDRKAHEVSAKGRIDAGEVYTSSMIPIVVSDGKTTTISYIYTTDVSYNHAPLYLESLSYVDNSGKVLADWKNDVAPTDTPVYERHGGTSHLVCQPGAVARAKATFRYDVGKGWQSVEVTSKPITLTEDLCGKGATPVGTPSPATQGRALALS